MISSCSRDSRCSFIKIHASNFELGGIHNVRTKGEGVIQKRTLVAWWEANVQWMSATFVILNWISIFFLSLSDDSGGLRPPLELCFGTSECSASWSYIMNTFLTLLLSCYSRVNIFSAKRHSRAVKSKIKICIECSDARIWLAEKLTCHIQNKITTTYWRDYNS